MYHNSITFIFELPEYIKGGFSRLHCCCCNLSHYITMTACKLLAKIRHLFDTMIIVPLLVLTVVVFFIQSIADRTETVTQP